MMAPPLSASSASRRRAIVPSGRISPARCVVAISVPVLSSTSTRKNVSTTVVTPSDSAPAMSSLRKVGASDGGGAMHAVELGQAERQPERGGEQDADQDRARHARAVEPGDDRKPRQASSVAGVADRRASPVSRVAGDQPHLVQADQAEEQADAGADAEFQRHRMALTSHSRMPQQADDEEQHAGEEDRAERDLPGDAHALHHGEGEVGVEPHAGRQRERQVGEQPIAAEPTAAAMQVATNAAPWSIPRRRGSAG